MPASPFAHLDAPALARAWQEARPFSHVILDGFVPPDTLDALRRAVAAEPHYANQSEIYEVMGSLEPMQHPTLASFAASFAAPESLAILHAITGKTVTRVEMRSYLYLAGSFLLPHNDLDADASRRIAYAFYLLDPAGFSGGELELFDCTFERGEIVATEPAAVVPPAQNRLVLFDVTSTSVHQVREVLSGGRCSLSGWFFA